MAAAHLEAEAEARRFPWLAPKPPMPSEAAEGGASLRHRVYEGAIDPAEIARLFPAIQAAFVPHSVRYGNTNPNIAEKDGKHGASVEWKASCYCEVAEDGGAMQKAVVPSRELLHACEPLLTRCDEVFSSWYRETHGARSIQQLVRLQSFVTRYRPVDQEAGLLRHIDGAHVDGSIILALSGADGSGSPIDIAFSGGGVTVWEGAPEVAHEYPMRPGDICALDNYVWHQGNPIQSGERWALVIFYQTRYNRHHRLAKIILNMAKQVQLQEAGALRHQPTLSEPGQAQAAAQPAA